MANGLLTLSDALESRPQADGPRMLPPSPRSLNLLLAWPERTRPEWAGIFSASIALHIIFFASALKIPSLVGQAPPEPRVIVHRIPLYLPPDVMTQREPNRAKVSKEIDLADLMAKEQSRATKARPRPTARHFELPKENVPEVTKTTPQILPEAPKVAMNHAPPKPTSGSPTGLVAPPAPPKPQEPSGPFQDIGSDVQPNAHPTLAPPKVNLRASADGAPQNSNGQRLSISEGSQGPPSLAAPGTLGQDAAQHSAVELQSDPEGADFKPYLRQILAIVRANWRRVLPQSARLGQLRGRTVMEFVINRDGSLPKIVIAAYSGSGPLDRAAAAGLAMSNPLPPLPADFKGSQVRLAFTFSYNMPE